MAKIDELEVVLGCDPEVFVREKATGQFVSAYGMIEGTKTDPQLVPGGMVQVDGMALEFGIDPAPDAEAFVSGIRSVLDQLQTMIGDKYELVATPIAYFSQEVFDAQPEEALELGCEPDFNAYTLDHNPRPNATGKLFRSGGGHVHIGIDEGIDVLNPEHLQVCATIAAELDLYLGCPSMQWDKSIERRSLYGKAGAFRPKPYGLEYRSLSNSWLNSDDLIRFVFNQTVKAVERCYHGKNLGNGLLSVYNGAISIAPRGVIDSGMSGVGSGVYQQFVNDGGVLLNV